MDRGTRIPNFIIDLAKIVGGVIRDSLDVNDYRITLIIEKRIDDKQGVIIESISVDKRMSALHIELVTNRLKEFINRNVRGSKNETVSGSKINQ